MLEDTFMQTHLLHGEEKIEKICLIQGKIAVLMFNNQGELDQVIYLEKGGKRGFRNACIYYGCIRNAFGESNLL